MFDLSEKTDAEKTKFILGLHGKLKGERLIYEPLMEVIEKHFSPRSYRLLKDGKKENHGAAIFSGVPEAAKTKFVRGVVGYLVSRQPWWLRMSISDQSLIHNDKVKEFLDEYNEQLKFSFSQSTFYKAFPHCVEDGVTTGPGVLMPEYNEVEHRVYYKPKSHWRVWLMDDEWGRATVYHEELEMKAIDALNKFGEENLPTALVAAAKGKRGKPFDEHQFIYAIYKNPNHDPESIRTEDLPYIGYYICLTKTGVKGSLVEEKGRPWFPIVLRINGKHGQVYNTHRTLAAEALTESKIVNSLGKAKLNLAHKEADPPLWGPKTMENKVNRNAGGYTGVNNPDRDKIQRLVERANWPVTDAEMKERELIVNDKFFVRFFELLSQEDLPQMTAFQASLMSGEKAILMGPITEPIEEDVLTNAVDIQAMVEVDAFLMPDPPAILFEAREKIIKLLTEFDGPLTQLRRNLLTSKGTLTGLGVLGEVLRVFPSAARKVKDLELVEDVSIESGAKQRWFRSDEEMLELDKAMQQQQEQEATKQALLEAAKVAPNLGKSIEKDSLLGQITGL